MFTERTTLFYTLLRLDESCGSVMVTNIVTMLFKHIIRFQGKIELASAIFRPPPASNYDIRT